MNCSVKFKFTNKLFALFFETLILFMLIMNTMILYSTTMNKIFYSVTFIYSTIMTIHIFSFRIDFSDENDYFIYRSLFTGFQRKTINRTDIVIYNIHHVHNKGFDFDRLTVKTKNDSIKITDNNFNNYHEFCDFIKSIK